MNRSVNNNDLRYRALADAALAAAAGEPIDTVAKKGLIAASEYMGLAAGALILWNDKGEVTTRAITAKKPADEEALIETENNLLSTLRRDFKLNSGYMDFGGEKPRSLFYLPVEIVGKKFGALIGIRSESTPLHEYDLFLKALAAVLALATAPGEAVAQQGRDELAKTIKAERDAAIIELSIAVNHEINNPLTALLGNLQLLNLKHRDLSEDVVNRLKTIEESANQIKDVTGKLMTASTAASVEYTGQMKMIDLSRKKKDERKDNKKKKPDKDD